MSLRPAAGGLILEVCDDGAGFDPTAACPGHLGLVSMRERAARIGGRLELVSAAGRGTTVRVSLARSRQPAS